jgi:hypothetical protein
MMEKSTEIVSRAIIQCAAKQVDSKPFLHDLAQTLFMAMKEGLEGDPVTAGEVGRIGKFAGNLRDQISN